MDGRPVDTQAARDILRARDVILGTLDAIIGEAAAGIKKNGMRGPEKP